MRTFLTLCAAGLLGFATIGCDTGVDETDTTPEVTVEEGTAPAVDADETDVQIENETADATVETEPAEGSEGDAPVVEEVE